MAADREAGAWLEIALVSGAFLSFICVSGALIKGVFTAVRDREGEAAASRQNALAEWLEKIVGKAEP